MCITPPLPLMTPSQQLELEVEILLPMARNNDAEARSIEKAEWRRNSKSQVEHVHTPNYRSSERVREGETCGPWAQVHSNINR